MTLFVSSKVKKSTKDLLTTAIECFPWISICKNHQCLISCPNWFRLALGPLCLNLRINMNVILKQKHYLSVWTENYMTIFLLWKKALNNFLGYFSDQLAFRTKSWEVNLGALERKIDRLWVHFVPKDETLNCRQETQTLMGFRSSALAWWQYAHAHAHIHAYTLPHMHIFTPTYQHTLIHSHTPMHNDIIVFNYNN